MNVLFLDKEGGYGGSSRSLYFLIKSLDRSRITTHVVSREIGPIAERYRDLKVSHSILPMPLFKPSKRKNLIGFALFLFKGFQFAAACCRIGRFIKERKIQLLYLNHDGFFPYAILNRFFWKTKIVSHMRTMIPVNRWGKWQANMILAHSDGLIFITENELQRFCELSGASPAHEKFSVVPNIAEPAQDIAAQRPEWMAPFTSRFKAVWLSNISMSKGADRALLLAKALKARGRQDIVILVCGEQRNKGSRTDALEDDMRRQIQEEDLGDFIYLAGFQDQPEKILAACQALIRTTRENDPWGRDVIEAIASGKPVLATGEKSPYVENGVNGFLFSDFDAEAFALVLCRLADDPKEYARLSEENLKRGEKFFSGKAVAKKVEDVFERLGVT